MRPVGSDGGHLPRQDRRVAPGPGRGRPPRPRRPRGGGGERASRVDFVGALAAGAEAGRRAGAVAIGLIAEVKRRSPSKGDLAPDLDPAALARRLRSRRRRLPLGAHRRDRTSAESAADLEAARAATSLPALRKDFTVAPLDLYDAAGDGRRRGAAHRRRPRATTSWPSCIGLADELGLAALVEVHDEAELERALDAGATLVGVNQRDLHTFEVDTRPGGRGRRRDPRRRGQGRRVRRRGADDVAELEAAGFDAVLVGEALVTAEDPACELPSHQLLGRSTPCS